MSKMTRALAVAAGIALAAVQAAATGTDAGHRVSNTATVDYTVGTVNQPDVTSNAANFVVDRRVLLTVAEVSNVYTDVTPGDIRQVLTFTVTNDTNATLGLPARRVPGHHRHDRGPRRHGTTSTPRQSRCSSTRNANGTYDFGVDNGRVRRRDHRGRTSDRIHRRDDPDRPGERQHRGPGR
jgi:hypothetical protein